MAVFTEFGADVDEDTMAVLDRGAKLTELLVQPQGAPYSMPEEVVEIYSATGEALSLMEKGKVRETLKKVLDGVKAKYPELLSEIANSGDLSEENKKKIYDVLAEVVK